MFEPNNSKDPQGGKQIVDFLLNNNLAEYVEYLPSIFVNGFFFDAPTTGWSTTDFIQVVAGEVLQYSLYGSNNPAIKLYSPDKDNPTNIVTWVGNNDNTSLKGSVTIATDGFIRVTNRTANSKTDFFVKSNKTIDKPIFVSYPDFVKNEIISNDYKKYTPSDFKFNGYLDESGQVIPNIAWYTTDFIRVFKGEDVNMELYGSSSALVSVSGLMFFDSNKQNGIRGVILPALIGLDNAKGKYKFTAPESGYVRVCNRTYNNEIDFGFEIGKGTIVIKKRFLTPDDLGNSASISDKMRIDLDKPNGLMTINLTGIFPTVAGEKQNVEADYIINGGSFLKTKSTISLQGQSSLNNPKKNLTFDIKNINGDKLKLKFGDFIATDSFHLKGFQKDVSMVRDHLTSKLWHTVRKAGIFPDNRIDNLPLDLNGSDLNYFEEDAKFFADGIPIKLLFNGVFQGLYVLRLKKTMSNYRMDTSKNTNIFLEYDYTLAGGPYVLLKWQTFDPIQFEVKSPKISGYVAGGPISNVNVMTSIDRLWAWTSAIYNNTPIGTLGDNVVLSAWIDYLITLEVCDHWDGFNNNILLTTHDGLKWSPYIYDTDHTFGITLQSGLVKTTKTSFSLNQDPRGDGENKTFWKNFRTLYLAQIKARYTELRNEGVISIQNVEKIALEFISPFSADDYKEEFAKWGYGLTPSLGKAHLRQILTMANSSINYIDSQWLLPKQIEQ